MCIKTQKYDCGKCIECLQKKRNEWIVRLRLHSEAMNPLGSVLFGMMTYKQSAYDYVKLIDDNFGTFYDYQTHLQKFFKRFRKNYPFLDIKYFVSTELGSKKGRLHHHPIFFIEPKEKFEFQNSSQRRRYAKWQRVIKTNSLFTPKWSNHPTSTLSRFYENALESCWENGFLSISDIFSPAGIVYATKYMLKETDYIRVLKRRHKTSKTISYPEGAAIEKHLEYYMSSNSTYKSNGLGLPYVDKLKNEFRDVELLPHEEVFKSYQLFGNHFASYQFRKLINSPKIKFQPIIKINFYDYSRPLVCSGVNQNEKYPLPRYFVEQLKPDICKRSNLDLKDFNASQKLKYDFCYIKRMLSTLTLREIPYYIHYDGTSLKLFIFDNEESFHSSTLEDANRLNELKSSKLLINFPNE